MSLASDVIELLKVVAGYLQISNPPAQDDNSNNIATTGWLQTLFSGSGKQSITANGYQKLPGGLIIQWGSGTTSGAGAATITLPTAFPNGILSANVTLATNGVADITLGVKFIDRFSFGVYAAIGNTAAAAAAGFQWIAIGY